MADNFQEKTEEATPRRKQEARKKGTVTKSVELVNSLVLVCMLAILPSIAQNLGKSMMESIRLAFLEMPDNVQPSELKGFVLLLLRPTILAFLPLVGMAIVVGVGANVAQVGFNATWEPLNPTLNKINPLTGLKRMFSAHAGMEGLKALAKTAIFGLLAHQVIQANWAKLISLSMVEPGLALATVGDVMKTILTRVATAWLVLAAIDYLFQRKQIDKQLKMTKEEVKQEFKQNETSPELRAAMSQRRRKLLRGRTAQAVRQADVIITNPTHYAVAVLYDREKMHAPQVVAKGTDFMAAKIRELAAEAKVPIVPNPPLARQLYKKCEVGDFVPREMFQAVAEILAYVYGTLKKVKAKT